MQSKVSCFNSLLLSAAIGAIERFNQSEQYELDYAVGHLIGNQNNKQRPNRPVGITLATNFTTAISYIYKSAYKPTHRTTWTAFITTLSPSHIFNSLTPLLLIKISAVRTAHRLNKMECKAMPIFINPYNVNALNPFYIKNIKTSIILNLQYIKLKYSHMATLTPFTALPQRILSLTLDRHNRNNRKKESVLNASRTHQRM